MCHMGGNYGVITSTWDVHFSVSLDDGNSYIEYYTLKLLIHRTPSASFREHCHRRGGRSCRE